MQRQVCRYLDEYIETRTYTYNGNQLTKVEDAVTATSYTGGTNFVNGSTATTEYTYDNNGNLTKDLNKGISNIQYNVLNLPNEVLFDNGATQTYHYTADGEKWRTVYTAGMLLKDTVDYCGGAIIENGVLKKLLTPVGYVDMSGTTPSYYYYLKDHQGNNRVVINSSGAVQETNHYYPFGSLFSTSTNIQPYKYNGKELDTKKGLNWYDYGARHYDAVLGRWHVVDPLAEKYYPTSLYAYCINNPARYIDPDGRKIVIGSWWGRFLAFMGVDNYESKVQKDIAQLKKDDVDVAKMIDRLERSDFIIEIGPISASRLNEGKTGNSISPNNPDLTIKQGSRIEYNPNNSKTQTGRNRTPRVGLAHELGHADDLIQGKGVNFDPEKANKGNLEEQQKGIENERNAIEMENKVSVKLNESIRNADEYYDKLNQSLDFK